MENVITHEEIQKLLTIDKTVFDDIVMDIKDLEDNRKVVKTIAKLIPKYINDSSNAKLEYDIIALATIHCKNAYGEPEIKAAIRKAINDGNNYRRLRNIIMNLFLVFRDIPLKYKNMVCVSITKGNYYCTDLLFRKTRYFDRTEQSRLERVCNSGTTAVVNYCMDYSYTEIYSAIKVLFKNDPSSMNDKYRDAARRLYETYFNNCELLILPGTPTVIQGGHKIYVIKSTDKAYNTGIFNTIVSWLKEVGCKIVKTIKNIVVSGVNFLANTIQFVKNGVKKLVSLFVPTLI